MLCSAGEGCDEGGGKGGERYLRPTFYKFGSPCLSRLPIQHEVRDALAAAPQLAPDLVPLVEQVFIHAKPRMRTAFRHTYTNRAAVYLDILICLLGRGFENAVVYRTARLPYIRRDLF